MSRNTITTSAVALGFLLLGALPGSAQYRDPHHGFVAGFGGAGATEVTSPFFGGSIGVDLGSNVQITAEGGRIQNIEATFTHDDLAILDRELAAEGLRTSSSIKVPTNYLTAGVRVRFAHDRTFSPYLVAQGGIAHMSPEPSFVVEGLDITGLMKEDDAELFDQSFGERTRPMATLGGGVIARISNRVFVDMGYKFSGIFIKRTYLQNFEESPHSHDRIDTHRFYGGIGLTF